MNSLQHVMLLCSSDFIPTVKNKPPGSSSVNHIGLVVGLAVGAAIIIALAVLGLILRRRKKVSREDHERAGSVSLL